MLPYTVSDIEMWADACTSVDTLRSLYHTFSARAEDLDAAKTPDEAKHLLRPHVLVAGAVDEAVVPPLAKTQPVMGRPLA